MQPDLQRPLRRSAGSVADGGSELDPESVPAKAMDLQAAPPDQARNAGTQKQFYHQNGFLKLTSQSETDASVV
jgi:hypothetical protein